MPLNEHEAKLLDTVKARLASGVIYPSADSYYYDRDLERELEAKARGMSARKADPMGWWYGRQSN